MRICKGVYIGKYATAWELQVWRIWVGIHQPRFWKTSGLGFARWVGRMWDD